MVQTRKGRLDGLVCAVMECGDCLSSLLLAALASCLCYHCKTGITAGECSGAANQLGAQQCPRDVVEEAAARGKTQQER